MESIVKKNSYKEVLAKIGASRLSEREKRDAITALGLADAFVDMAFAAADGVQQLKQRFARAQQRLTLAGSTADGLERLKQQFSQQPSLKH